MRWFGEVVNATVDDATQHRVRSLTTVSQGAQGIIGQRIRAAWATSGNAPIDGAHLLCGLIVRINLADDGTVVRHCFDGLTGEGECNFEQIFGRNIYCTANDSPIDRSWPSRACDPYNWATLAMDGSSTFGAAMECTVGRALPPLRWSLEFLAEAMRRFTERGALSVIEQTRLSVVAVNTQSLDRLGLLSDASEELRNASHALSATVNASAMDNPQKRQLAGTIAALAAVAVAIPVIGTAAAAILGVAGAFVTLSPFAIGVETDALGRGRPFYEIAFIDAHQPPTMDVPDPPGFVRTVTLTAILPIFIPPGANDTLTPGGGGAFGGGGASSDSGPPLEIVPPATTPLEIIPPAATPPITLYPVPPEEPSTKPKSLVASDAGTVVAVVSVVGGIGAAFAGASKLASMFGGGGRRRRRR